MRLPLAAVLLAFASVSVADDKPIELFNGRDLTGWKAKHHDKNRWQACAASFDPAKPKELIGGIDNSPDGKGRVLAAITGGGSDLFTEANFGDCTVELEFLIPKDSNSGVYLMGEYEVQVFDSYGKKGPLGMGDLGAIYGTAAPKVNPAKKPGEWQTMYIEFRAPRFENGKKTANAKFVRVAVNGVILHEDVEVKGPTTSALTGKETPTGPLMLQGDHGPVAYRNIKLTPRK
jgi:hypothetical protein